MKKVDKIQFLLSKAKNLSKQINQSLLDKNTKESGRYVGYRTYVNNYEEISREIEKMFSDSEEVRFHHYNIDLIKGPFDTPWTIQKSIMEGVKLYIDEIVSFLESETSYVDQKFDSLSNYIHNYLRKVIHSKPTKEKQIQDAVENLLIGREMDKGIDYDRESGKFEFSGKEYIPDFIINNQDTCIEVKLIKEGTKSRIIDEINADITAYSTKYERLLFIIYDLGEIRDVDEFKKDIETEQGNIKVIIVKH